MVTEFTDGVERTYESNWEEEKWRENMRLRPLCGSFLDRICLPDTLTSLGSLAFYCCAGLREISIGRNLVQIGSDAFMNCRSFRLLTARVQADEPCAARQILAQISSDLEVCFAVGEGIQARAFFPEYFESYDEIAPAHLFGRKIEGEGFRARQCFKEGRMDFGAYDEIFAQACADESIGTLGQMAEDRLRFPFALSECAKSRYEGYLRSHDCEVAALRVQDRDLESLRFLYKAGLLSAQAQAQAAVLSSSAGWMEGAVSLLQYQCGQPGEKRSYEFDGF